MAKEEPRGADSLTEAKRIASDLRKGFNCSFHVVFAYAWDKYHNWKISIGTGGFDAAYVAY